MKKFKVTYLRTITETYETEIEANHESEVQDIIYDGKYGDEIEGETLIESYSDGIEVTEIEEIEGE